MIWLTFIGLSIAFTGIVAIGFFSLNGMTKTGRYQNYAIIAVGLAIVALSIFLGSK